MAIAPSRWRNSVLRCDGRPFAVIGVATEEQGVVT
jgi:hypothetical protein